MSDEKAVPMPVAKKPVRRKAPGRVSKADLKKDDKKPVVETVNPTPVAKTTPEQQKAIDEVKAQMEAPQAPQGATFVMDRVYFKNSIHMILNGKRVKQNMLLVTDKMNVQLQDGFLTLISGGVCRINVAMIESILYKK